MSDQYSFNNIDSLLCQLAIQTRELSQKKNEINQQIKACRAEISERKSYIQIMHRNIKKLEEEITLKQKTVIHNKANAKSMKAANTLLLQYELTLKEELESRKANYKQDMEVYEERIASYWKIFQSHNEYYCQNPLAQKLLTLQAEREEIESRIKACDDQITMKEMELDHLTGRAVNSSSPEKLPHSVSCQQPITEPGKQFDPQTEEDNDSSIDISSLHLNQTSQIFQDGHKTPVVANAEEICEENQVQDTAACSPFPEEVGNELSSCERLDEQKWPDVMLTEEKDEKIGPEDQVLEQHRAGSDIEEAAEEEMEERVAIEEEKAPSDEDHEGLASFPQPSSPVSQSTPATMKAVPSTPSFAFNFSPASSPYQGTSDTKSPAFLFSVNSGPSTPGFSGFGFDVGAAQDEDSPFPFTGSFFKEKKTTESKSSSCTEFLFGQPEQSEGFQFAFSSESPETTNKDNTKDDFSFPFNF